MSLRSKSGGPGVFLALTSVLLPVGNAESSSPSWFTCVKEPELWLLAAHKETTTYVRTTGVWLFRYRILILQRIFAVIFFLSFVKFPWYVIWKLFLWAFRSSYCPGLVQVMPFSGHGTRVPLFNHVDIWGDELIEFNSVTSCYYSPGNTKRGFLAFHILTLILDPNSGAWLVQDPQITCLLREPSRSGKETDGHLVLGNFHRKTEWHTSVLFVVDNNDLYCITFHSTTPDWAPVLEAENLGKETWNMLVL